mmetsp:Transcript_53592/g.127447  ORF Transcript_53592/g.127447 Transcript_53592/m.127447 type:complete len:275 (-) Transcript_53592:1617-2441(-)
MVSCPRECTVADLTAVTPVSASVYDTPTASPRFTWTCASPASPSPGGSATPCSFAMSAPVKTPVDRPVSWSGTGTDDVRGEEAVSNALTDSAASLFTSRSASTKVTRSTSLPEMSSAGRCTVPAKRSVVSICRVPCGSASAYVMRTASPEMPRSEPSLTDSAPADRARAIEPSKRPEFASLSSSETDEMISGNRRFTTDTTAASRTAESRLMSVSVRLTARVAMSLRSAARVSRTPLTAIRTRASWLRRGTRSMYVTTMSVSGSISSTPSLGGA